MRGRGVDPLHMRGQVRRNYISAYTHTRYKDAYQAYWALAGHPGAYTLYTRASLTQEEPLTLEGYFKSIAHPHLTPSEK